jgi:U3 small nucleolar ribonucleoprotein component
METLIRAYEEENFKSRNWSLQGEAVADERRKDELLEQFMDVDYRSAVPPTITEQKTAQLEGIIRKRIKEKVNFYKFNF